MTRVIYGDILFAINFSMDFLSLYIVSCVLRRRPGAALTALAAGIGAAYSVADAALGGNVAVSALISAGVSVLMCYILFGGGWTLLRASLLLYAVSAVMGGGMTMLFSLANRLRGGKTLRIGGDYQVIYNDITLPQLLLFAAVCAAAALAAGRLLARRSAVRTTTVCAEADGKTLKLCGLVDSGALLCDPLGGRPVIITSSEKLEEMLPTQVCEVFRRRDAAALGGLPPSQAKRVRLLPSTSVGGNRLLFGLLPDSATVGGVRREVCIAADPDGETVFGGCEALIPAVLVD